MRFRAGGTQDYYYTLTAKLTARGQQALAMRVMAFCILALSLPAVIASFDPASTRWPVGRPLMLLVTVTCCALTLPWLRHRWPSRTESRIVVIVGAAGLSVGCMVAGDPLAGLLIAVAFPFILGYTALCHSARMLWWAGALAALTIGWLTVRIAMTDVSTAAAVAIPVTLITVCVVVAFRFIARIGMAEQPLVEVDLVTSLPTRESFYERAATLIGARHRGADRYLALAVVDIDAFGAIVGMQGARRANRVRVHAANAVRESIRRDAIIGQLDDADFIVADTFTDADPSPLIERLRGAIAATPAGITASVGVVSTLLGPVADRPPDDVLDDLIARATAAMLESRKAGGNQARYVVA